MIKSYDSFLLEARNKNTDFSDAENVCFNCGSIRLTWHGGRTNFPTKRDSKSPYSSGETYKMIRHYRCEKCRSAGNMIYKMEFIKNDPDRFDEYLDKLDDHIKNKDYSGFINTYNNYKIRNFPDKDELLKWQERYKKRRPENIDIIDGANIGLFGLKKN